MENKRFTIKRIDTNWFDCGFGFQMFDFDKSISDVFSWESDLDQFCNALNELHDENLRLKAQLERLAKP